MSQCIPAILCFGESEKLKAIPLSTQPGQSPTASWESSLSMLKPATVRNWASDSYPNVCSFLRPFTYIDERATSVFWVKTCQNPGTLLFLHQNSLEMIGNGDFELIQETPHSRPVGHSSQQRTRNGLPLRHPMGRDSQRTGPRRTMESVDRMFPVGCWVQLRLWCEMKAWFTIPTLLRSIAMKGTYG